MPSVKAFIKGFHPLLLHKKMQHKMLMRCWVYSLLLQANHSALLWQPIRNSCCKDIAGDGCSRGILEKLCKGMIAERLPKVKGSNQDRQQAGGQPEQGQGQSRGVGDRLLPAHLWEGQGAQPVQQFLVTNCTQTYAWADGPWDLRG